MKKRKMLFFSLILVLISYMTLSVYAVESNNESTTSDTLVQINKCITSGEYAGAYNIKYDSSIATKVDYTKITDQDVINGHIPYPDGVELTEEEKKQYNFTTEYYSKNCYTGSDGKVYTCPTSEQISKTGIYDKLNSENYKKYVTFTLNETTGKFTVAIKDILDKDAGFNILVRYVAPGSESNAEGNYKASRYSGQFLSKNNGVYKINNVTGSSDSTENKSGTKFLNLEFYIAENNSTCGGVLLGQVGIELPNANNYEIDNPATDNPDVDDDVYDVNYCKDVLNYTLDGMTTDEKESFNSLKNNLIGECYTQHSIGFDEKSNLKSTIDQKFETLKSMFVGYQSLKSEDIVCSGSHTQSKLNYSYSGTYWAMSCFDNYTAQGDTAKLVAAGGGFEYQTNYSITRTCTIKQINKAQRPAACYYDCGHICYWNESTGVKSGSDGGPNEDFDKCISECDGGSYTQTCINSCYNKVYKDSRDLSFTDKFSYGNNPKSKVERLSNCITNHNRPGEGQTGGCGESYCVSDFCNTHGGYCVSWSNVYPSGCVDNPDAVYKNRLDASERELNNLIAKQEEIINAGSYTYEITDSYLKTDSGKKYVFTVNSETDPKLSVKSVETVNQELNVSKTSELGNHSTGQRSATYNEKYVKTSNITVSLPLSYINKLANNQAYYKTDDDSSKIFSVNHKNSTFNSVDFSAANYYGLNEHKYYTNVLSDNINIEYKDGKAVLKSHLVADYNIKVISNQVGKFNEVSNANSGFSSTIQCYYGVYNKFYSEDDETCDPKTEVCDGGIQYIYRPIDLTNMFADRNARWNWTGTLDNRNNNATGASKFASDTYLKYDIDPEATIEEIQTKGNSIYNVSSNSSEVDYEIVLTKENIRNIRNYNKNVRDYNGDGSNNYLDYNMSCYTNNRGKEICTSRFLDNIDGNSGTESAGEFITYSVSGYGIDARKSIAGCNNAIGGTECDD